MSFFRVGRLFVMLFPALFAQDYKLERLVVPDWSVSAASAINNRGAIVGSYRKGSFGRTRGFKRDANGVFEFPINEADSASFTNPLDINDFGVIVGFYYGASGGPRGFLLQGGPKGTVTSVGRVIGGINNNGDFAGTTDTGGFISVGGVITEFNFPGGSTAVWGISWDRTVVGSSFNGQDTIGFIRGPAGKFLAFRVANAATTIPLAINNAAGKIVGYYADNSGIHGFVYDYIADLAAYSSATPTNPRIIPVLTIDAGFGPWTYITGINANGVIVGYTGTGVSFTGVPQP